MADECKKLNFQFRSKVNTDGLYYELTEASQCRIFQTYRWIDGCTEVPSVNWRDAYLNVSYFLSIRVIQNLFLFLIMHGIVIEHRAASCAGQFVVFYLSFPTLDCGE